MGFSRRAVNVKGKITIQLIPVLATVSTCRVGRTTETVCFAN
jgi:hypothetical protein